jgi:hypothetical protein
MDEENKAFPRVEPSLYHRIIHAHLNKMRKFRNQSLNFEKVPASNHPSETDGGIFNDMLPGDG